MSDIETEFSRPSIRRTRSNSLRLPADQAKRQGEITKLALLALGREAAISFLNEVHPEMGGRPLDLATASNIGRDLVEAEIGRLSNATSRDI